ncbi:MAG: translation initiation factor 2 [Deltaproteobacteria bacterium]|jgi:hypothetical protein|nr:translation initiation factor 2 [Deltaproteobacteria bacterium]
MKPSKRLNIYIATSANRNLHAYLLLRDALTEDGHIIADWSKLPEFPLSPDMPLEERRERMSRAAYSRVYDFCSQAAASSDLVIYIGPAGQDAACEVGMAANAGVPIYGLRGFFEAPGTILGRAVTKWFDSPAALLDAVDKLSMDVFVSPFADSQTFGAIADREAKAKREKATRA